MTSSPSHADLLTYLLSAQSFRHLTPDDLPGLDSELEWVILPEAGTLFQQGDLGDALYVIVSGQLRVTIRSSTDTAQVVDELEPGVTVGEMALLTGQRRVATVTALSPAELVRLSKTGFDRLAETQPEVTARLAQIIVPRLHRTELVHTFTHAFGELSREALHALQAEIKWRHCSSGEVIMRQGEPGDSLCLVVSGRFSVIVKDAEGVERVVGEVGRGETVGELALLTDEPRSATVIAMRDSEVAELSHAAFDRLRLQYPQVTQQIMGVIVRRLQQSIRGEVARTPVATTLALFPLSRAVPIHAFAEQFIAALTTFGSTLHLTPARFESAYGRPGAAQTPEAHPTSMMMGSWLTAQEMAHRYVVYEADPEWSEWTQRCLRQADRILLVGNAHESPEPVAAERQLHSRSEADELELVLLHPPQTAQPLGTLRWLEARAVRDHHHVRLHHAGDVERLARRLTGHAWGLVLGGGGARGWAHIGVARAMEEAGLPIDLIGGTSAGAIMGAGIALEMPSAAILRLASLFSNPRQMLDYTLPLVSFFAGYKLSRLFQAAFGEVQIEDLWRPFFCISSNLSQDKPMVHRRGPLWKYVRASTAIPGVFAPVLDNGEVLMDGGVIDNLPINVMRAERGVGRIAAVNVSPKHDMRLAYNFGDGVSGWQMLWSRINPFGVRLVAPNIMTTLVRSATLGGNYLQRDQRQLADLYLNPPVDGFPLLDGSVYERIIEVGYRYAQAAIAQWLAERHTPI